MAKEKKPIHKKWWFWVIAVILFFSIIGALTDDEAAEEAEEPEPEQEEATNVVDEQESTEPEEEPEEEPIEITEKQKKFAEVVTLIEEGKAFDTGSYIKGDVPKGEYAFITFGGSGQYYSEEDASGNIIDNENFDSFGYVYVHEAGNLETQGALINIEALDELNVSGAKELYEILNDVEGYIDAGWYKVGSDIEPGQYIIESYGEGYAAIMSGPLGNGEIINNEIFNGRYGVNVSEGQYLVVSRGNITRE